MENLEDYTEYERNRDLALEIVSDSGIVAPLTATANLHSRANPKSYMYVFSHPRSIRDKSTLDINVSEIYIFFFFA